VIWTREASVIGDLTRMQRMSQRYGPPIGKFLNYRRWRSGPVDGRRGVTVRGGWRDQAIGNRRLRLQRPQNRREPLWQDGRRHARRKTTRAKMLAGVIGPGRLVARGVGALRHMTLEASEKADARLIIVF
jgi:hypothetical protein